jgi:hypothetical protein
MGARPPSPRVAAATLLFPNRPRGRALVLGANRGDRIALAPQETLT